jgi:4-aminobutyrate aminotransferase-like enzyme
MAKTPNRKHYTHILTDIPGPKSEEWISRIKTSESGANAYPDFFGTGCYAPVFVSEDGACVNDIDGNTYLETSGCYSCGTFGYRPLELIEEAYTQMKKLVHVPDVPTVPRILLSEELKKIAPGELKNGRVQYEVGGGGTMDLALKVAYFYSSRVKSNMRHLVMSFWGNYHGRTVGMTSLCGSAHIQLGMPIWEKTIFLPFAYCYRCFLEKEYPACDMACLKYIRRLFESEAYIVSNPATGEKQVSILFYEPIQAHLGMIIPPKEFFSGIRRICDDYDIVLVDDEIAMRIGHTGHWFACDYYNVVPDIIGVAKALTGGVWPLGAIIAKKQIMDVWGAAPDKHMGSYHGNPVGCAVALKNIKLMKERNLLENVKNMGSYMLDGMNELMKKHKIVGEVAGAGLALGMEIVKNRKTKEPGTMETIDLVKECMKRGVLVLRCGYHGNRLNMMPPLDISKKEIDTILNILDDSLYTVENKE